MKVVGVLFTLGVVLIMAFPWLKSPIVPDPNPNSTPIPYETPLPTSIPKGGTTGTQMPVIFEEWWLRAGDRYAILSGPTLSEGAAYRTNLMFTWSGHLKFKVEFIAASGSDIGNLVFDTYNLEPCEAGSCSGYYQLNNALRSVSDTYDGLYAVKVIPIEGDGKLMIFATSIDNLSQDPTLYSQFRFTENGSICSETGFYAAG